MLRNTLKRQGIIQIIMWFWANKSRASKFYLERSVFLASCLADKPAPIFLLLTVLKLIFAPPYSLSFVNIFVEDMYGFFFETVINALSIFKDVFLGRPGLGALVVLPVLWYLEIIFETTDQRILKHFAISLCCSPSLYGSTMSCRMLFDTNFPRPILIYYKCTCIYSKYSVLMILFMCIW